MKSNKVYIVLALIAISIIGFSVYGRQKSDTELSGLNLANTEILANAESISDFWIPCYSYVSNTSGNIYYVTYCGACPAPVACSVSWGETFCTLFW